MRKRSVVALTAGLVSAVLLALGAVVVVAAPDTDIPWSFLGGGGGGTSSSTNYELGSTAGQSAIGLSQSTNFRLGAGYWYGAVDSDGEGLVDILDPCPSVVDCDGDSWTDWVEAVYIGTDALDGCADDEFDDAWPADINNDGFSDISDIGAVAAWFGQAVPPALARLDVAPKAAPDGFVDISDIGAVAALFGQSCA